MAIEIGIFAVPDATNPQVTVDSVIAADRSGLELVGIQDHPYQRRFFDSWTLLSYLAARTERIRLVPDVLNLPLRLPSVLAKSAASLDLLSGGRLELGLGAGAFWDAVEAMGGPRRTPGESVDALEEAIAIIRAFWAADGAIDAGGPHYRVKGAKGGPPPAHPIGLWIGAYKPRMLRLTGRLGDGWLPSYGNPPYMPAEDVPKMHAAVDEGAREAGRDPADVKRVLNVMHLEGSPDGWAEHLARLATELRFSTLLVGLPSEGQVDFVRRLGEDAAPRARELAA
ncbi:MAG: hypothetical protein QOD60_482 [Solirubrobacterales bacterium]|jgi:alkanesulfonate monooxygenase SsuD/methylene tetrahydromethanopterin reductase-like flavin-dependent oxidoreductase (luciferase family)|nr:hypothetical protein [Solirubrobacterales bacterium]